MSRCPVGLLSDTEIEAFIGILGTGPQAHQIWFGGVTFDDLELWWSVRKSFGELILLALFRLHVVISWLNNLQNVLFFWFAVIYVIMSLK